MSPLGMPHVDSIWGFGKTTPPTCGLQVFPPSQCPSHLPVGPAGDFTLLFILSGAVRLLLDERLPYPNFFPDWPWRTILHQPKASQSPPPFFHSFGFWTCGLSEPLLSITRRSGQNGHFNPVRLLHSQHTSPKSYSTFKVLLLSSLTNS